MFKVFFLLFLLIPLIELYVLIQVGSEIGALPTILLTITTAIVGAGLMRSQGIATIQRAQQHLVAGRVPEVEMIEGMMIFVGGLCLFIPGFITDAIGLLLLIPPIRQFLARRFIAQRQHSYARYRASQGQGNIYETEWTEQSQGDIRQVHVRYQTKSEPDVIEGEVVDNDSSDTKK